MYVGLTVGTYILHYPAKLPSLKLAESIWNRYGILNTFFEDNRLHVAKRLKLRYLRTSALTVCVSVSISFLFIPKATSQT